MNFNDIADFLDLVKHPTKFDKQIKSLRDEEERLQAAIATVGKASELDKLIKTNQALAHNLQAEFFEKKAKLDSDIKQLLDNLKVKQTQVTKDTQKNADIASKYDEAYSKLKEQQAKLESDLAKLEQRETSVTKRELELEKAVSVYNQKAEKLKSVLS